MKTQSASPNLSLPPFLRTRRVKVSIKGRRAAQVEVGQEYGGVTRDPHAPLQERKNERFRRQHEPFSSRFATNVFAQMLAMPVREERITSMRLPRAAMVEFHAVGEADGVRVDDMAPRDAANKEARDEKLRLRFHPRMLFAELVRLRRIKGLPEEEQAEARKLARELLAEQTDFQPLAAGSYVLGRYKVLKAISENNKKRAGQVASLRLREKLAQIGYKGQVHWQEDMHDFVLGVMKKTLQKSLGGLLRRQELKGQQKIHRGLVCEPPGEGLSRLWMLPDVAAVIRLKPVGEEETTAYEAYTHKRDYWAELKALSEEAQAETDAKMVHGAHPEAEEKAQAGASIPQEATGNGQANIEGEKGPKWVIRGQNPFVKNEGFLEDLKPLPPPQEPSPIYYPTLQHWNRRIPIYHLPFVLGEEATTALVGGTSFEGTEYLVVRAHEGTRHMLQSLLRLHTYLAEGKDSMPKL